ncbi:hypothetical protein HBB16_10195 [Pseudonocardia sp. MCCB 268]|nr:hypothetical protein [Pseudonocardia cytotoxica]
MAGSHLNGARCLRTSPAPAGPARRGAGWRGIERGRPGAAVQVLVAAADGCRCPRRRAPGAVDSLFVVVCLTLAIRN